MPMRVPMVNLRKQGSKLWEGLGSRDHQSSGGRDGRVPGAVSGRGRGSRAHRWRAWGPWSQPTPNHLTLQGSVQGWALGPGAGPEPRQRQPEPPRAQWRARDLRTRTPVSQVPTGGTWPQGPGAQQGQDGSSPRAESRKRLGRGHASQWSAGAAPAAPPTGEVVAQGAQRHCTAGSVACWEPMRRGPAWPGTLELGSGGSAAASWVPDAHSPDSRPC